MKKKVSFTIYVILVNILSWYLWRCFCNAIWKLLYKNESIFELFISSYALLAFIELIFYYSGILLRSLFVFLIPYWYQKAKKNSTEWNIIQKIYLIYLMVKIILDGLISINGYYPIIYSTIWIVISLIIDISIVIVVIRKASKKTKKMQIDLFADIAEVEKE